MEIRITFRSEVYIQAESLQEAKTIYEEMPIFSADALEEHHAEVVELVSVEDANTYHDYMSEWNKCWYPTTTD